MFLFCLLSHLINGIAANTEIINFSATAAEFSSLPFTETWSVQIPHPGLSQNLTSSFVRHILRPQNSTLQWNMISAPFESTLSQSTCLNLHQWHPIQNTNVCPHEFWLVLDLDQDGWKVHDQFTLRLSWPAYVRQLIVSSCIRLIDSKH